MKQCLLVFMSGASEMVHFMTSFAYPTLAGPRKPLGEPLSVPQPPVPECVVGEERKASSVVSRAPFRLSEPPCSPLHMGIVSTLAS